MADFGFVGPAYEAPSPYQDCQQLICWYLEKDPTKQAGARGEYTLYPTPGRTTVVTPGVVGEVRGLRAVQGGALLLAVVGASLYTISSSFVATARATLGTNTGRVSITDNGASAYICDGQMRYSYTFATANFSTQADGGFSGGDACDAIDGYMIYNQPNSQNWGATSLNSTSSPALSVGKKDGAPDNLISLIANDREIYLLGEYTTEVWSDVGAFPFPFARVPGTSSQHGIAAKNSLARLGNAFAYVSQDRNGQGIVVVMNGYTPEEISNHAVTNSLQGQTISDAIAFSYQIEGHEFYVVTFPSIDTTWVYDAASSNWHKWQSWDGTNYHRNRANCSALFQGKVLVGDYLNGTISALDNAVYTENGATIRRLRRAPHLVSDLNQQFFNSLQIQFQPGVGLNSGQGSDPMAMLRWSNDGGESWSNEKWRAIGKLGRFRNRAIWRRLGTARDRVFELVVSDPIKAVVVSAELRAEAGDN